MADKKIEITKLEIKEQTKAKAWTETSSSEKDRLLYEVCKRLNIINQNMPYEKPK